MRKAYLGDITQEQFKHIRPLLQSARKKTKPRTIDLYNGEPFIATIKNGVNLMTMVKAFLIMS